MGKLIYAINLTLDGCCDHTNTIADEELLEYYANLLRDADVLVYGRKTYQLMVPYWPDVAKNHSAPRRASDEFAEVFVAIKKIVVFSKSMDKAEGKNTEIIRTNLEDEILKLKQQEGINIFTGGVDIPSQLIHLGLVDEYLFVVQPLLVGEGRRLLEGVSLPDRLQLKLAESKIFQSGCVALRYLHEQK
jgi:dihydrofolate reductase